MCRKIQEKTAVGNFFWKPDGASPAPLAYNQIADNLPEKIVSFFSSTTFPPMSYHELAVGHNMLHGQLFAGALLRLGKHS